MAKRYRIVWKFGDETVSHDVVDAERQLLESHARMYTSDSAELREIGRKYLLEVATLAAAARIAEVTVSRAGAKSVSSRRSRTAERDRRIHDAHARGLPQNVIAIDEKIDESTVSRVLKKPRPD